MYDKNLEVIYLEFVKNRLNEQNGNHPPNSKMTFRPKYNHILRVLGWAKKLVEGRTDIDTDALFTAAIFHDVGYSENMKKPHAEIGAKIFVEYATLMNMESVFIRKVEKLINLHSSKELLKDENVPIELIILMEADILDEEGALRMVWYSIDKGMTGAESYDDIYKHIVMGNNKRLDNPMITEKGKKIWDKKKLLVEEFTMQLEEDIRIGTL